ncbi:MAG TPA: efflux RND transporter periplasmic adaptor subunit [Acetobacteraceae bacterium]|nr:efflux RND transporter periplasmic adaptor subunit [Acetobacteraceae bacterium]
MDIGTRDPVGLEPLNQTRASRRSRFGMALLCVLLLAGIGAAIFLWPAKKPQAPEAGRFGNGPVPVLVTAASTKDVPIYLDGLGTVQAFNTVTIKPMVDGPLIEADFKEGQDVHKGDVLARIDPRIYQAALDQAMAKKAQDEAQLANAKVDLARYEKLVANKYASEQQAQTQRALVTQLTGLAQQDQAQIDTAKTNLSYTTITSPIDGRTGIRQVDAGNIVHASDATGIVVLTQLHPISVVFTLPQQQLQAVATAMQAGTPAVLAYAQGAGQNPSNILDRGQLAVLDNTVDQTTGTIKLKATFPNAGSKLWPGGFVGVRLQVATAENATVIPPAAVQQGPNGTYVYVVNADDTATRRDVTVSHEDEQVAIITNGVKSGDRVVTDGASRLTDGKKIEIAPAAGVAAPNVAQPVAPGAGGRRHRAS